MQQQYKSSKKPRMAVLSCSLSIQCSKSKNHHQPTHTRVNVSHYLEIEGVVHVTQTPLNTSKCRHPSYDLSHHTKKTLYERGPVLSAVIDIAVNPHNVQEINLVLSAASIGTLLLTRGAQYSTPLSALSRATIK